MNIIFDMETQDPDDMFALCFLGSHPQINLRAVTTTPGSKAQVGIIRHLLNRLNLNHIPVGARNPDTTKEVVSKFHYKFLGQVPPAEPDDLAYHILANTIKCYSDSVLLTGAPLQNLHLLLSNYPLITLKRWVAQGGFAGDNVVPSEYRLPKFAGKETCPTFNFNGDPQGALTALSSPQILTREIVSKNVCHAVVYNQDFHQRMQPFSNKSSGLNLIYQGMELYLRCRPEGKMFHDPLAACIAVNPYIATFAEVEMYRVHGEWGSRLANDTKTFITININQEKFFQTLTQAQELK